MIKKAIASLLIALQTIAPVISYAITQEDETIADYMRRANAEILVFSDSDPMVIDPTDKADLDAKYARYQAVKNSLKAKRQKKQLSFEDMVRFANAIRPYIVYLESAERISRGGDIRIPPGQTINIEAGGTCIDPVVPAPKINEPMQIIHNSAIVPAKAESLHQALRKYAHNNPAMHTQIASYKLHDLTRLQQDKKYLDMAPYVHERQFYGQIIPGGGTEYDNYVQSLKEQVKKNQKIEIQSLAETVRNWNLTSSINGLEFKAEDHRQVESVNVTVTNNSNLPASFNPINYIAAPNTIERQRLGLTGTRNIYINGKPLFTQNQINMIATVVTDATEFLGPIDVELGTRLVARQEAKSLAARKLLGTAPIASSVVAAWELELSHYLKNMHWQISPCKK